MNIPIIAPTTTALIEALTPKPSLEEEEVESLLVVVAELEDPELEGVNVALSGETVVLGYALPAALISKAEDCA